MPIKYSKSLSILHQMEFTIYPPCPGSMDLYFGYCTVYACSGAPSYNSQCMDLHNPIIYIYRRMILYISYPIFSVNI